MKKKFFFILCAWCASAYLTAGSLQHDRLLFSTVGFLSHAHLFWNDSKSPDGIEVKFPGPGNSLHEVGRFEKAELELHLPAGLENEISNFVNGMEGINPFDPGQISVEALFTCGAQKYLVYGYYFEDYTRDSSSMKSFTPARWLHAGTYFHWRVRFAPADTGNWSCTIGIRVNNEKEYACTAPALFFKCIPSANQGWLMKGNDKWHLACSGSGKSFFALGENIAWTNGTYFRGGAPLAGFDRLYEGGFLDVMDWVTDLAESGGNMVRIATVPWSWDFEYEHLNNYSDRLDRAWELDKLVGLCEQKHMKISLDLQFFATSVSDTTSVFSWAKNPYHAQIKGVNEPDGFLTNVTAQKIFKNKLRYFLSRWGYSTSLGILTLTGELDSWEKKQASEIADEKQKSWYAIMVPFVRDLIAYRPILTATSYASGHWGREHRHGPFDYEGLDILAIHPYNAERDANIERRYNEFNRKGVEQGVHSIWPDKAACIQEMGLPEHHPADANDIEGCNDISYHNATWSTAFMGGIGAGFPWWQWFNSKYRHENFPAMNSFFKEIDFQKTFYTDPDVWDDAGFADGNHSGSSVEAFYMRDKEANQVIGWVHNTSYWWGNMVMDCSDRSGKRMKINKADGDDKLSSPAPLPAGTKFEIHKLHNLENYAVEWYMTRKEGRATGYENSRTNIFGTLKLSYPQGADQQPDYAYKIHVQKTVPSGAQSNNTDTLSYYENKVEVHGRHRYDSLGLFRYHWIFGNGRESYDKDAFVIYDQPGTYSVTLIVTCPSGWSDTLRQNIVKPGLKFLSLQTHEHRSCDVPRGKLPFPRDDGKFIPEELYVYERRRNAT